MSSYAAPASSESIKKTTLSANLEQGYRRFRPRGPGAKPGQVMEVPVRFSGRMMVVGMAASVVMYWANMKLYASTPESMTPGFQERAARIGPVAERINAPPVFLNPIRNRIPGNLRGPEDLETV